MATRGLEPISYRGVLLNTLLHAIVYSFYNLLNVLVTYLLTYLFRGLSQQGTDCK
jgi:hypothetical protein